MPDFPEDPAGACEKIYYKLNGDDWNVCEVSVKAGTEKELVKKLNKVKEFDPKRIILNGTVRDFNTVCQTYLE